MVRPTPILAKELKLEESIVERIKQLLDDGYSIPYIARYRKDDTGAMDEASLFALRDAFGMFAEVDERRLEIMRDLEQKGILDDTLKSAVVACKNRADLEDLFLPFRAKKRTKVEIAKKLGLEPLAERIMAQGDEMEDVDGICRGFLSEGDSDVSDILESALAIVSEKIAQSHDVRQEVRDVSWREGEIFCRRSSKSTKPIPMSSVPEPLSKVSHHKFIDMWRSQRRDELKMHIKVNETEVLKVLDSVVLKNEKSIWRSHLVTAIRDTYERLLASQIEREIMLALKRRSDEKAISLIESNLQTILLQPPLPGRNVLVLNLNSTDELQIIVLDALGNLFEHQTMISPATVENKQAMLRFVDEVIERHKVEAVAIGDTLNGADICKLVKDHLANNGLGKVRVELMKTDVAEMHSKSDEGSNEYKDLYPTAVKAISIGRRMLDPLSEIIKVDLSRLELGQYQHELDQKLLNNKIEDVAEFCINRVGVCANTANYHMLAYVAGLDSEKARAIVQYRKENDPFESREALKTALDIDEKTFEQMAGFVRVNGDVPLDATAVHPRHYALVEKIAEEQGSDVKGLIGNGKVLSLLDKKKYVGEEIGEAGLDVVVYGLAKAGRDPRFEISSSKPAGAKKKKSDRPRRPKARPVEINVGMEIEGTVKNIAEFGVFVDIGGRREGMIHVSELAHAFVRDPNEILQPGDKVKVKVIEIDDDKKRIKLSRKQLLDPPPPEERQERPSQSEGRPRPEPRRDRGGRGGRSESRGYAPKEEKNAIASGRMAELLKGMLAKDEKEK